MATITPIAGAPPVTSSPGAPAILANLASAVGSANWSQYTQNRYTFFDYVDYPTAGTTEIQFFSQPRGSIDTYNSLKVKTLEQTNAPESRAFGRTPFLINNIRTHIRPKTKDRQPAGVSQTDTIVNRYVLFMNALNNLARQGTLLIDIGSKNYFDINQPFITAPPGFGPLIYQFGSATGNSGSQGLWFQQCPDPAAIYTVDPPQLVEAGQTFDARIVFDNGASPALTNLVNGNATPQVEIGLIFDGYIYRAMQ